MKVLILGREQNAHEFKRHLAPEFPGVDFLSVWEEAEAGDFIEKAEVLVCLKVSDGFLRRAASLRWIQSVITGTNYIEDLPSFQARRDLILTSSRGIHGPQMSELTIMLMIALSRQFPRQIRNQDRAAWERWPPTLLYRKKVAILGMGSIGLSFAKKCQAFQMSVLGFGRAIRNMEGVDSFHHYDELPALIPEVDYVVSFLPGIPENHHLINSNIFCRMKSTAYFLNLGRGGVVDEEALLKCLQERRIAGAALDVFSQEPLPADHPFWRMDNVIITPHVGGMADIYIEQSVAIVRENLHRYLRGERDSLLNLVPQSK